MKGGGHAFALGLAAAVLLAWGLLMTVALRAAALPDQVAGVVLAVFPPGTGTDTALFRTVRADGRLVRQTGLGPVFVVQSERAGFAGRLRAEGALAVFGEIPFAPGLGGCILSAPRARGALVVPGLDVVRRHVEEG